MAGSSSRSQGVRTSNDEIGLSGMPNLSGMYRKGEIQPASISFERPNHYHNLKVSLINYDITKLRVDAIVNAANKELRDGSGVNRAIRAAAGDHMRVACELMGGCAVGSAVVTEAFDLPCRRVIHAVGPRYGKDPNHRELLQNCYRSVLELAAVQKCKSVAFSCISTGVYGYPAEEAAVIAIEAVRGFLDSKLSDRLVRVVFCCYEEKDDLAYRKLLPKYFPPTQQELSDTPSRGDVSDDLFTVNARPQTPRSSSGHHKKSRSWDGQSTGTPRTPRDRGDGGSRSGTTPRESRRDRDGGSSLSSYEGRPSDGGGSRRYAQQSSYEGSGRSEPSRAPGWGSCSDRPSRGELPTRSRPPKSPRQRNDPLPPYQPGAQYPYAGSGPEPSGRQMQPAFDPFAGYQPQSQRTLAPPRSFNTPDGGYSSSGDSSSGGRGGRGGNPPRQGSGPRRVVAATPTPITGGIPETSENEYSGSGTPVGTSPAPSLARARVRAGQGQSASEIEPVAGPSGSQAGDEAARPRRDEASGPEPAKPRRRFSLSLCGGGGCMKDPINFSAEPEKMEAARHEFHGAKAQKEQQRSKPAQKKKLNPKKRAGFAFQGL